MRANSLRIVPKQALFANTFDGTDAVKIRNLPDRLEHLPRALLVSEVAELFNISERQVYKLAATREIPSLRIAGCIRFDGVVLASLLRRTSGDEQ